MTRDQIKHLLPIISAFAEGKQVQLNCCGKWTDYETLDFSASPHLYRIKPTPTLRPWQPEEVPVGALLRRKEVPDNCVSMIIGKTESGLMHYIATWKSMQPLEHAMLDRVMHLEHSLDHGKTWLPCGVAE